MVRTTEQVARARGQLLGPHWPVVGCRPHAAVTDTRERPGPTAALGRRDPADGSFLLEASLRARPAGACASVHEHALPAPVPAPGLPCAPPPSLPTWPSPGEETLPVRAFFWTWDVHGKLRKLITWLLRIPKDMSDLDSRPVAQSLCENQVEGGAGGGGRGAHFNSGPEPVEVWARQSRGHSFACFHGE